MAATTEHGTGARVLSWRPELPDHRDRRFQGSGNPIRAEVEPMGIAARTRIHDQKQTSACTGFAITSALELALGRHGDSQQLAPLFPYALGRQAIDEVDRDGGAYIRDVIKACLRFGVPRESVWRFLESRIRRLPSELAFQAALPVREEIAAAGIVYERAAGQTNTGSLLESVQQALSDGCPVVFGFLVYPALFKLNKTDHTLPLPLQTDPPMGGHAVYLDGYSMAGGHFWVPNSWGPRFGLGGRFKMPFEWFTDARRLVDDVWVLRSTAPAVPA